MHERTHCRLMWLLAGFLLLAVCYTAAALNAPQAMGQAEPAGVVITLHPSGFVPPQMQVANGRYLLLVLNRSGIRDLEFDLDREAGGRLHSVRDGRPKWKERFDLTPGRYVLSVANHAEWKCVITVTPR